MTEPVITVKLTVADAEILLGALSVERHNADTQAVCDAVRKQLDEQLTRRVD